MTRSYNNKIDIKENWVIRYDKQILSILLKDCTSGLNILWATDNYQSLGTKYESDKQITPGLITGKNGNVIKPRVEKNKTEQLSRVREKAEVFTPSWICNKQNNLIDEAWFGHADVFNTETANGWSTNSEKITFLDLEGKSWEDYIHDVRLEVSCGEAPYLVSRYDTITGEIIPVNDRIGMLDRKLRVVSENNEDEHDWFNWSKIAFQSIYGYEWQGDNILLARENLMFTFIDFYVLKFGKKPPIEYVREIAEIISWNIWQMDGLKGVIPDSCKNIKSSSYDLFGVEKVKTEGCKGCEKNNIQIHNGTKCLIKDWKTGEVKTFVSLIK
ncbi:MAG: restriction endonuclease subunit M [Paludibacter sp.]|nr:restriction endonuclease subunit M [Paludibacter sp.]